LKQQLAWIYAGAAGRNESYPLVEEYFTKKALSEIGYQFQGSDLDDITAHAFFIIDVETKRLQNKKSQAGSKRRGR